jgi:hypothetical protein
MHKKTKPIKMWCSQSWNIQILKLINVYIYNDNYNKIKPNNNNINVTINIKTLLLGMK